jgi:hypothetical protein
VPTTTPASRHKRAQLARESQRLKPDNPKLVELRREFVAERIAENVARALADAPPLTPEQRDRIAAILRAGGDAP